MGATPERPVSAWPLALMLLVSGGCALVYQVVWIRELRLIFGATTASSAAVLAIFMAGLGLGNGLLGKWTDRSPRPLRLYSVFEVGIAVSAGLSPLLIGLTRSIYLSVGGQSELGPTLATAVRLVASAAILAIPTFLMGGTLPAVARAVSIDSDTRRRRVALLYGLNTLGGVLGAGLTNFFLLETFGNRIVLWSACALNLLLAAVAWKWSAQLADLPVGDGTLPADETLPTYGAVEPRLRQLGLVCVSSGIVGFVFFLMEIVWYRMLGPLLGGTTYTFGLILCIALLGIGIGGALYTLLAKWLAPSPQLLATTCALEALLIAIPFGYGDQIALWVLHQQSDPISSFAAQIWNWFQVGAVVILPPSLVAGFQFPLLIAIAGTGRYSVGTHVGLTFAANTAGAISGSLAGGFLLLPILTAPGIWQVAVWLLIALAASVVLLSDRKNYLPIGVTTAVIALAIVAISLEGPTAVWRHSGIGAGRADLEGKGRNAEQNLMNRIRRQCVWEAEGIESSVAITSSDGLSFYVNGKSDGNAYQDAGTQMGLGLIGSLLHPAPKQGLVIGLGTGESAGWLADTEGIEQVDVVELEPAVVRMAERCAAVNRNVMSNPKTRLHYNDAREFLLTTKQRYDLIVSEPSNPYRAGVANLYTREFYRSAANRLAASGLFLQWLQSYEVDARTVQIVLRTIRSVFPTVQVWRTQMGDMVIVCSPSPTGLPLDAETLRQRLAQPAIGQGLHLAWRAVDLEGVLAHFVCGHSTIDRLLEQDAGIPLNTDDQNLLEYAFAKTVGKTTRFSLQELQNLAQQTGETTPLALDPPSVEKLARRRLAMLLHFGGAIPTDDTLPTDERSRAETYKLYLANQYVDAAKQFEQLSIDTDCPIELTAYAHTLAEAGRPVPDKVLAAVRSNNETEAHAIAAIAAWRQGKNQQAAQSLVAAFAGLRSSPWGSPPVLRAILPIAADLGEVEPATIQAIYEQLSEPFSVHRLDEQRRLVRYLVSEKLDKKYTVEALAALEPNVPWKDWFLKQRARVYAAEKHPLADAAHRDVKRYRKWAAP